MSHHDSSILKAEEQAWQNRRGGALQEAAYGRPGTQMVLHRQFSRIADALRLRPRLRVLDLGCGVGHLLSWLGGQAPAEYYGLDLSATSIANARSFIPTGRFLVGDAEQLPYRTESFDRVILNGSAHHLLNLGQALREVYRVMTPGGRIVLFEPIATPITSAIRRALLRTSKYESPADLAHKEDLSRQSLEHELDGAGFSAIVSSACESLAYPLSGMYIDLPFGRSRAVMERLLRLESRLERSSRFRPLLDQLSWRRLIVADKTPTSTATGR
jgi:ubiquinone/menaquinone biosynthesis C-methylase UbiE